MNEIFSPLKSFLGYLQKAIQFVLRGFNRKSDILTINGSSYFKKRDRVETKEGNIGTVWRVYKSIKTGKPVGCSVIWDLKYKGEKLSTFLPVDNFGEKYNPILKQSQS